jgi:integral membrane protein (TIGR01906 family)
MTALLNRYVPRFAVILLVMAVPLFLITTNVSIVINSGWLYNFGFERYDIEESTGIEKPELMRVAREIKHYFNSSDERLSVRAEVFGTERELFNEREVEHMVDVKGLVRGVSFWQQTSFYTMVGIAVAGLVFAGRGRTLQLLGRGLFRGSVLTIALLVTLGVGSLFGFETLFEQFHFLSFSNDLWRLDPRRDYLIRIFPEGFFLSATLIIAGLTIGQALLTGGAIWAIRRRGLTKG